MASATSGSSRPSELRPVLDHRHAAAETAVRLGEFQADVAAAEDDQVRRQAVEFQRLDVRQRPGVREAGGRRDRRPRPDVEEDPLALQHARAAVAQAHLQRFRRHEPPVAHDQLGAALSGTASRCRATSPSTISRLRWRTLAMSTATEPGHDPELRGVVQQVGDFGAPDLVLAGQAVDVRAGPADLAALDDRHPAAGAARCQASKLAARPAARTRSSYGSGCRHGVILQSRRLRDSKGR